MPKYKELRQQKGMLAREVAEKAGIEVTMYSRIESYKALPIPTDFVKIIDALQVGATEVYTPDEVRLLPEAAKVTTGGARAHTDPDEYKMTVRLSNAYRDVLTREVLQACGYKSINDWVNTCVLRLKNQYAEVKAKEKPRTALSDKAGEATEGRHTTTQPPTTTNISQKNHDVKEDIPQ